MNSTSIESGHGVLIEVVKPGLLTTLQDLGRVGFQGVGVPVSGAMDERSHRVANLLVGNEANAATLEITLMGPSLRFLESAVIAIAGADLSARIGDEVVMQDVSIAVEAGMQLDFGKRVLGMRAYLAIDGGFAAGSVMGSRSTYLRGKFGGLDGRALRRGDLLSRASQGLDRAVWPSRLLSRTGPTSLAARTPRPAALTSPSTLPPTVRLIRGAQWDFFASEAQRSLLESEYRLSPKSDRMGFRFDGPRLDLREPFEMISEAVAFGTVQVPADGQPIVLMADRQTTGGYPKIGEVASVDLPILAQLMPGEKVRFALIPLAEAQRLDRARSNALVDLERETRTRARS